jgi:hypothetical protein
MNDRARSRGGSEYRRSAARNPSDRSSSPAYQVAKEERDWTAKDGIMIFGPMWSSSLHYFTW